MGYFGHVNCSDNFNAELEPYTIEPRKGWPAINFFFNTAFDAHNQYLVDEPWSRPGDYVLLRATTDLVCLSSACPDDIDPANAWNPTEVHVRVYPAKERFSAAIAHRVTPDAEAKLTQETGFHEKTSALTSRFTEYNGYWLPTSYDNLGAVDEYWACREKAAVMDLSPLRKFEILGPDAEALMQATMTRDIRRLADGQVVYTAMCNETGGMLDDGTVFRIAPDNFRFVGGAEYDGVWLREQAERLGLRVWVKESTDDLHNIAVQGPASREILARIVWTPPAQTPFAELTWFRFSIGRLGGPQGLPLIASRTGYSGELGYELFCHPKDAPALYDAVMEAGASHGIAPLGLDALDMLRIEAGLIFAGYEFDDQVDPFEAGIGFTVTADKEDDFVGRDALLERRAHPQRVLVGLELEGNETAGHGDCVHVGRSQIGVITSGTRSPILKKNIALCRIAVQHAEHRHRGRGRQARRPPEADPGHRRAHAVLRPREAAPALVIDAFSAEQVEAFDRDGFLIVEEGLVSPRALDLLRERYEPLFDGVYETGIKPDEVNWVPGRDPEDRTRQICNGWRADNVIAAQVLSERTGRLGAQLARYRGTQDPAGQRALEAAGDEGDRLPPGLVVRRLPRAGRDADLLDLAPRDDRPTPARSSTCADRTCGRSRRRSARSSMRRRTGSRRRAQRGSGGRGARHRAGRRQAGRRLVPPRAHVARLGAEHERGRGADGARDAHAAGRGALPRDERRPHLLALPPPGRPLARRVVLPGAVGRERVPDAVAREPAGDRLIARAHLREGHGNRRFPASGSARSAEQACVREAAYVLHRGFLTPSPETARPGSRAAPPPPADPRRAPRAAPPASRRCTSCRSPR